ncbi:hypothetical protein JVU11DRAFT_4118, partial [Chiua virens]
MSRFAQASSLAQISDATLGVFASVPPSETLDHLIRFLSTWSGTDKLFTLIEYTMKFTTPLLLARANLQHRFGLRKQPTSSVATSFTSFSAIISDFKMLGRFWGKRSPPLSRHQLAESATGLLPILQWMRLQGWSMLVYYPLEHLYYLRAHNLIPATIPSVTSLLRLGRTSKRSLLNAKSLAMWSCRAWTLYVILQFAHLMEDRKLLLMKERSLRKGKGVMAEDREDLRNKWDAFWNEVVANSANLPLALHWSIEQGIFTSDIWLTIFGFINAVATFRSGWKATALPSLKAGKAHEVSGSPPYDC